MYSSLQIGMEIWLATGVCHRVCKNVKKVFKLRKQPLCFYYLCFCFVVILYPYYAATGRIRLLSQTLFRLGAPLYNKYA